MGERVLHEDDKGDSAFPTRESTERERKTPPSIDHHHHHHRGRDRRTHIVVVVASLPHHHLSKAPFNLFSADDAHSAHHHGHSPRTQPPTTPDRREKTPFFPRVPRPSDAPHRSRPLARPSFPSSANANASHAVVGNSAKTRTQSRGERIESRASTRDPRRRGTTTREKKNDQKARRKKKNDDFWTHLERHG